MSIGFSVSQADSNKVYTALEGLEVEIEESKTMSKVSAVGLGMQSHPGVASRFFSTLAQSGINSHMVSTSEIKISAVIDAEQSHVAVSNLHAEFI